MRPIIVTLCAAAVLVTGGEVFAKPGHIDLPARTDNDMEQNSETQSGFNIAIFLLKQLAATKEAAKKFDGRIIYIENLYYRGRWLHAVGTKREIDFKRIHEDDVVDHVGLKWRVKKVGESTVVLENMKYNRNYLDAQEVFEILPKNLHRVYTTYSSYPQGDNSLIFEIQPTTEYQGIQKYSFASKDNLKKRLAIWQFFGQMDSTFHELKSEYRIYIPPVLDGYRQVAKLDNSERNYVFKFTFQEQVGIEKTNGQEISETVSVSVGVEIKGALSASSSYSKSWTQSSSETFSRKVTQTVQVDVQPREIVQIQQLVGTYGPFKVFAKEWKVVTINKAANTEKVVYVQGMEDYNNGMFIPEQSD